MCWYHIPTSPRLTYTYTHTGVPVGTTEFILIRSLYGDTRRYYRNYISTSYLILVLQSLFGCFRSYPGISEHIHVFRILYMYYITYTCISDLTCILRNLYWSYGTYTGISDLIHVLQNLYMYLRSYIYITELILVLRNLYWYFGSYTCITELIHVFKILHVYYGTYTYLTELIVVYRTYSCLTDLILVLQNCLLPYGSYSCAKVPISIIIRNGSGSYHIQGQIRLLQIRTFVFRRYRSQILYKRY